MIDEIGASTGRSTCGGSVLPTSASFSATTCRAMKIEAEDDEEIRVVDLAKGVERLATPDEIASGIEYRDYDHFMEGRAA